MTTLSEICSLAIAERDIESLQYLINVCDELHNGAKESEGFPQEELPTDEKYEEMRKIVKQNTRSTLLNITTEDISSMNKKYLRKTGVISNNVNTLGIKKARLEDPESILVVDGIQVQETIEKIPEALLMKKYDGCTIACIFTRCGPLFKLDYARTRGADKGVGRKSKDVTTKMSLVINDFENSLNSFLGSVSKMRFNAKNSELLGNTNETVQIEVSTIDIQKFVIRGELVLREKVVDKPNCSAVAGPLNGKFETFRSVCDGFCWKPFEIINITLKDGSKVIPCQYDVIQFLMALKQYDPNDFIEVKNLDGSYDFLGLLTTWQHETAIPLDGIVYCPRNFTYPTCPEESSKRVNYGKYKFKKNNIMTTKINAFEYSIGATGKFSCMATVEPIISGGKTYIHLRLPMKKIQDALKAGPFGINTVIEVELSREMALTLSKTFPNISSEVIPYEFPKKCPYCDQELELKTGKADSTLKCLNKRCKGILMKRLEKFLSELGLKGISEKTIFNYFENRPFNFKDFYRDVINVPMKSTTRRTGKTIIDNGPKYNFDELMANATNQQLLIAFQIATQSTLKGTMERYGLNWDHKDNAALRRIDDELIKEVL